MYKDYQIAGLRVRMRTFGRTLTQAEAYLAQDSGEPDILITSDPERLRQQQPHLSLEDCEYLSTGASFYRQLLRFDGMLLHASAVVLDGFAYLFSAPCGTGKSTHTALWLQAFGSDRAQILNDDKPALRRKDGRWYAYGTPWSGKTSQNRNLRVPLGGVCVLTRGETNSVEPFGGSRAAFALLEQTARPSEVGSRQKLLELVGALMEDVPVWKMRCTPTVDAAYMAQEIMSQEARKRWALEARE